MPGDQIPQLLLSTNPQPITSGTDAALQHDNPEDYERRTNDHLDSLKEFAFRFKKVIPDILAKLPKYNRVKVLLFYWELGDPDMSGGAKDLERLFKDAYGYEAECWPIPRKDSLISFTHFLSGQILFIQKSGGDNLLIVYYGGHGVWDKKNNTHLWKPVGMAEDEKSDVSMNMTTPRDMLKAADCDLLLLFDCCYSLAMMGDDFVGRRRVWLLAAAGNVEKAGGKVGQTYTFAITKELEELKSSGGVSSTQLNDILIRYDKMYTTYKLQTTPQIRRYSAASYLGEISIAMHKKQNIDSSQEVLPSGYAGTINAGSSMNNSGKAVEKLPEKQQTDARMLIKIAFRNPADKLRDDLWEFWFKSRPPNFNEVEIAVWKQIEVVGLFPSNSSMVLLTMPVGLWAFFPQHPAYECLGVVRSRNMISLNDLGNLQIDKQPIRPTTKPDPQPMPARLGAAGRKPGIYPIPPRDNYPSGINQPVRVTFLSQQSEKKFAYPFWSRRASIEEIPDLIGGRLRRKKTPYGSGMTVSRPMVIAGPVVLGL